MQAVLLCLLLGASAAGTSVFGVSREPLNSGNLLGDCFGSLKPEALPWRGKLFCTLVGLTVLCCHVGELFCTLGKLCCRVGKLFCTLGKLCCTVGEQFCTSGNLFCTVGSRFCLSVGKRLPFRQRYTWGTCGVAVVQGTRTQLFGLIGQPCFGRHLAGPEGHGSRLRLLLLWLLVLPCNGHLLRGGGVNLGCLETRATPGVAVSPVLTGYGSIPPGGRTCWTGTECCLRDQFASDPWLHRGRSQESTPREPKASADWQGSKLRHVHEQLAG